MRFYWNLAWTFLEPCWNLAENLAGFLMRFYWNLAWTFLGPCWNLAGTLLATLLEPCWNLPGLPEPCNLPGILLVPCWNLLTSWEPCCSVSRAILLGFNLWAGEWHQQSACSGKPEHYWNLARMSLELFAGNCWNIAGKLLEPAGNWSSLAGTLLESRWNFAGTLLEPFWNMVKLGETWNLAGKLLEHCWSAGTWWTLAGTWWNLAGTSLEPCCWKLWLEHVAGNQCGCRFRFSFYIVSCFAWCGGLWGWKSGLKPCWNLYEDNF